MHIFAYCEYFLKLKIFEQFFRALFITIFFSEALQLIVKSKKTKSHYYLDTLHTVLEPAQML